jgi:hypothetical protein
MPSKGFMAREVKRTKSSCPRSQFPDIHAYISPIATTHKLRRLNLQVPIRVEWKLEQRGACNCLTIVHTVRIGCNEEIDNATQTVRNADALPSVVKGYDDGLLAAQECAI